MLVVLPGLAFAAIFTTLVGRVQSPTREDLGRGFISSLVVWGVLLVAGMEVLSLLDAIRAGTLAAYWGMVTIFGFVLGGGMKGLQRTWGIVSTRLRALAKAETYVLGALLLLAAALFVIAVVSPPNNVDSLNVHLPRVVHLAQNESLDNYFAISPSQLTRPPFAELAILNVRSLYGSDRPAALVQWSAFVSSIIVATVLAAELGASRKGQMVAATFSASIPLAILESTNTKNDLVVSLWVLCAVHYVVSASRRPLSRPEALLAGAALGLGLLTKGTFQPAILPFLAWLASGLLRRSGVREGLAQLLLIAAASLLLNLGYWGRNVQGFGTPFGKVGILDRALEIDELLQEDSTSVNETGADGVMPGTAPVPDGPFDQRGLAGTGWSFLSRLASMLTLHTIYPEVGGPIRSMLARLDGIYDPGFLASLEEGLWNHEDSAGGLLGIVLAIGASIWALTRAVRTRDETLAGFILASWLGWSLLSLITTSTQLWGIRYQLSFMLLSAALIGVVAGWLPRVVALGMVGLLLLSAIPYVLLNNTRPLIGLQPRTRSASILVTSSTDLLFTSTPEVQEQYRRATSLLQTSSCRQVGLDLRRRDLEYSLWWLLEAPQSGFELEVLRGAEGLRDLAGSGFEPCAVLCTQCGQLSDYLGLPLLFDGGYLRLYADAGV